MMNDGIVVIVIFGEFVVCWMLSDVCLSLFIKCLIFRK